MSGCVVHDEHGKPLTARCACCENAIPEFEAEDNGGLCDVCLDDGAAECPTPGCGRWLDRRELEDYGRCVRCHDDGAPR